MKNRIWFISAIICMISLSLYNPTVKSSEIRFDLVIVKGFDVKNIGALKELETYVTIKKDQIVGEKAGCKFSIFIKNKGEEVTILNPLDFLDLCNYLA